MAAYLLTWNPGKWHWWEDDLEDEARSAALGKIDSWSCVSKSVRKGDRVFLSRTGREPRGIFASGTVVSDEPYLADHWDSAKRGRKVRYVDIRWDTFLNPSKEPILPRHELERGILGQMHWSTQQSGIHMRDDIAAALERRWKRFRSGVPARRATREQSALEGELREAKRYTRGRSRVLRDHALRLARGRCEACRTDYSKVLDGHGRRVLEVHHRRQLSLRDAPRLTKLSDLAVVCANCHRLLHFNQQKTLPVEALRKRLARR